VTLKHAASDLDLRLQGRASPDFGQVLVHDVRGSLLNLPLRMQSPLELRLGSAAVSWKEAVLTLGQASLSSRGEVAPDRVDITASLRDLDLDPALLRPRYPSLPEGVVSADMSIRGTPLEPDARLTVRADRITFASTKLASLPTMTATADCRLRKDLLEADAALTAGDAVHLDANLSSPVQASLHSLRLSPDARLNGRIQGRTRLSLLPHVLRLDDQTLEGDCDIDYRIGGTWDDPTLVGKASVLDARYENFRSGTVIAGIRAEARAEGSRIVAEASGTDGHEGRTWAQGLVDLTDWSYSVDANMEAFRLLRTDLVRSVVAGTGQLHGAPGEDMSLKGSLTMDPTEVRLPPSVSRQAPHIEVREINTDGDAPPDTRRKPRFPLYLDLNVRVPARLSVQGRGLDSEWSGTLHLGGTQIEPVITGEANLLRGKLDFLDRTFDLTKGSLAFNGETPPNPFLDITGEVRVLDTLIQVNLSGPARSPRLALSSTPPLPQDELLSMILFGRSMREISPLQAVRLAQAAAEMTGIGDAGFDFMKSLKSKLGLQELEVSRDEDDNTAVGVGGYIGGKYYFRTKSSVSGQDTGWRRGLEGQHHDFLKHPAPLLGQLLPFPFFLLQSLDGLQQVLNGMCGIAVFAVLALAQFFVVALLEGTELTGGEYHG
jgi:translocation and assembly module TamB